MRIERWKLLHFWLKIWNAKKNFLNSPSKWREREIKGCITVRLCVLAYIYAQMA